MHCLIFGLFRVRSFCNCNANAGIILMTYSHFPDKRTHTNYIMFNVKQDKQKHRIRSEFKKKTLHDSIIIVSRMCGCVCVCVLCASNKIRNAVEANNFMV